MVLSVSGIQNILRTYSRQLLIARLNSEEKRGVTQLQEDRVDISEEARQMLDQKPSANTFNVSKSVNKTFNSDKTETLAPVEDYDF